MANYPIRVPRDHYFGKVERRRRKAQRHTDIAKQCEEYLNKNIQENPAELQRYLYGYMAIDLNLTTDDANDVMFAVDCGHNGITVRKTTAAY